MGREAAERLLTDVRAWLTKNRPDLLEGK